MSRTKIPVLDNLTPDEQAFVEGSAREPSEPEKQEPTVALNMVVPVRIKNEMKAYKEYAGFKRVGDLQETVWEFFKEHHQSKFQDRQNSWNLENKK